MTIITEIKAKKALELPEALQYILDKKLYPMELKSAGHRYTLSFDELGSMYINDPYRVVPKGMLWIVDTITEITDDTEFDSTIKIVNVDGTFRSITTGKMTIKQAKKSEDVYELHAIIDGSLQKIWSKYPPTETEEDTNED